jgi:DNA-binding transcriptional MerR regulator
MSNQLAPVEIPAKAWFKATEVCDLLQIPTYVLRTWENEFKDLGVTKAAGGARAYRRQDVELACRIKELVFTEHLTLAGVRRRLEQENLLAPPEALELPLAEPSGVSEPTRARIVQVKDELRALLQQLAQDARREAGRAQAAAPSDDERAEPAGVTGKGARPAAEAGAGPDATRLDPAALNFASIAAPPAPKGSRRRRDR